MTAPKEDVAPPASALVRYSVKSADVGQVRQQIPQDAACDDQMVRQFIMATGGDLALVRRLDKHTTLLIEQETNP